MNTTSQSIISYHPPVIESENLFSIEAGGIDLFFRCYCDPPGSIVINNHKEQRANTF